jgi:hypothetical protein
MFPLREEFVNTLNQLSDIFFVIRGVHVWPTAIVVLINDSLVFGTFRLDFFEGNPLSILFCESLSFNEAEFANNKG